jgi:hypothetical protein
MRWTGRGAARLCGALAAVTLASCTSDGGPAPPNPSLRTVTQTRTRSAPASGAPTGPIRSGPTTARQAPTCPLLAQQAAADRVGMRLARITVLHSAGSTVGCRFYALQGSPLHGSEHLPGPHQPAVDIVVDRYRSGRDAHNAVVRTAERGRNLQAAGIGDFGACYQTRFFAEDRGEDWACAFQTGTRVVVVRTVVVSPALNVVLVARRIAARL